MTELAGTPDVSSVAGRTKTVLVLVLFGLLFVLGVGLFFAFLGGSTSPVGAGWFLFSFTMGLTMIVLPCTFPLAFVIVPLAMGKSPKKGFAMALAFGLGVAATLSLYGVAAAVVGKVAIGTLEAPLETVKNWLYAVAGIFAYLFALGELGFLKLRMPTYSGAAPMFIQKQGDVFKALLLGLFMGNIGVGCPHPATPLILTRIAASEDVFYGWLLFFVHALGRITPLLILAILGILGVNALSWITKRRVAIERATGWAMVFVAAFIFTLGFFTHDWWVNSGQHTLLEEVTQEERLLNIVSDRLKVAPAHAHGFEVGTGLFGLPLWLGNWALVFLWVVPLFWYVVRRQNRIVALSAEEQAREWKVMPWLKAFVVTLTLLLGFVFTWALPHRFLQHEAREDAHGAKEEAMEKPAGRVLQVNFISDPEAPAAGELTKFVFTFPGANLDGFEIEHERFVHLVVVREDLVAFSHVHLEPVAESPASFEVAYTFPFSGRYLLSLNYLYNGVEGTWKKDVQVAGNDAMVPDSDTSRRRQFDAYEAALTVDPQTPRAGEETHFLWTILKDGKPVTDLEPYLAAPAHIAVVRDDLGYFLHEHGDIPKTAAKAPFISHVQNTARMNGVVGNILSEQSESKDYNKKDTAQLAVRSFISAAFAHGDEAPERGSETLHGEHANLPSAFGPAVEGHLTFSEAGRYKVFAEFLHNQKVLVTGFLIDVEEGR